MTEALPTLTTANAAHSLPPTKPSEATRFICRPLLRITIQIPIRRLALSLPVIEVAVYVFWSRPGLFFPFGQALSSI